MLSDREYVVLLGSICFRRVECVRARTRNIKEFVLLIYSVIANVFSYQAPLVGGRVAAGLRALTFRMYRPEQPQFYVCQPQGLRVCARAGSRYKYGPRYMYIYIYIYTYTCVCVCVCVCIIYLHMLVRVCVCVCLCVYNTHTYTCIHTNMHN